MVAQMPAKIIQAPNLRAVGDGAGDQRDGDDRERRLERDECQRRVGADRSSRCLVRSPMQALEPEVLERVADQAGADGRLRTRSRSRRAPRGLR